MITVYLAGLPNFYEGEDIEIRYRVFEEGNEIIKKSLFKDYKKPALVSLFALITFLKDMEEYKETPMAIMVNDAALMELIRGTSTVKDREVIKWAASARERLKEFKNTTLRNAGVNAVELAKWDELLTF